MWFVAIQGLLTGLFTVFAFLCTRRVGRVLRDVQATAHSLRKYASQHELIVEEQAALSKRMHKLSGRFYRAQKPDVDAEPERDPHTVDLETGSTDSELAAMLALQRAHSAP